MIEMAAIILSDLRQRLAARIGVAESAVAIDTSIMEGLGLTSLDVLEFLMEIEDDYPQLDLEDPATRELCSLNDLAKWLAARRA
jgi:acyl carrier protein